MRHDNQRNIESSGQVAAVQQDCGVEKRTVVLPAHGYSVEGLYFYGQDPGLDSFEEPARIWW